MGHSSELFLKMQENLAQIEFENENGNISNLDAFIQMREYRAGAENILELAKSFENNKISEISSEANMHNGIYKGFQIKEVSGRKTFDYKAIPEWIEARENLEITEQKYKSMFEAKIKGNPHANISKDGEELPLPELKIAKGYLTVKKIQ